MKLIEIFAGIGSVLVGWNLTALYVTGSAYSPVGLIVGLTLVIVMIILHFAGYRKD